MKKQYPYRVRVKGMILKAVELRVFLLRNGKSKNHITYENCQKVLEDINYLRSDTQLAEYLVKNQSLIENIFPAVHKSTKVELNQLAQEASDYLR